MEQNLNNPINTAENNTNLKQQYNTLKQKIATLEKNNKEILEMYKAEEQRLIKSNEFLMQKNNIENSRSIHDLEAEVLKMRNDIRQLQNLIEPKNINGNNLIENENLSNNTNSNNKLNASTEEKIKEEYLINYKNKLKSEFEKKLLMKHQELISYYTLQNKNIIDNDLPRENIIDIDQIKNFSIKPLNNISQENLSNESSTEEANEEINISNTELILSILCLKEEYPKDFFIDYVLEDAYSARGKNDLNIKIQINNSTKISNKKMNQSVIQHSLLNKKEKDFNNDKTANKICQLFEIKNSEDINLIKKYVNEIYKIDNNLRNYFEKKLAKYRFAMFEKYEKDNFNEKIKYVFGNDKTINEITDLLVLDENIINLDYIENFLNKYINKNDNNDEAEFVYYILSLMKVTKNERKHERNKRIKNLRFFEFNMLPFYQKIMNK